MDNDADDYAEQWVQFLSHGPYHFSKELLTSEIALLVSPDGSKIIVIGDTSGVRCKYDEEGSAVYVNFCNGGGHNSLTCPACGQYYMITREAREQDDEIVFIQDDKDFYRCACGMMFVLYDRYEFVSLPINLEDLAPLYFAGLSQNADLLVRYILAQDGQSLVEEVSEVRKHWVEDSCLTERPGFRFEAWTIAPCFCASDSRHDLGVQNVRIWRKRKYKLGSDTFEEETYRAAWDSWDKVTRKVGYRGDSYTNQRMLEALDAALPDVQQDSTPSGGRPVKFEPTEQQIKDFAPEYKKAKDALDDKLKNRSLRQLGRYEVALRMHILKQAYPDAPDELLKKMSYQRKASRAALHYAFWKIKAPIGVWEATQLNQLLSDSRERQSKDFSD
jgi:hypothetical protein